MTFVACHGASIEMFADDLLLHKEVSTSSDFDNIQVDTGLVIII